MIIFLKIITILSVILIVLFFIGIVINEILNTIRQNHNPKSRGD